MNTRSRSAGFTLIETLVAFVIAATSLGLLFRIEAKATTALILAEEYLHATELAQSLVAELPVTEAALAFRRTGTAERKYEWIANSEPYDAAPRQATADPDLRRLSLRTVTVEVKWASRDGSRRIELRTIKPFFARPAP